MIYQIDSVMMISSECYIIDADIQLNMLCYEYSIPFQEAKALRFGSTEKNFIALQEFTPRANFLINKGEVQYIEYGLQYLDNADFDGDGYDEIIFRMHKYNYLGYLLLTDKWTKTFLYHWTYH